MNDNEIQKIFDWTTQLSETYDDWINQNNCMEILNIETNNMCKKFIDLYPEFDTKQIQCVTFAFMIYMMIEIIK